MQRRFAFTLVELLVVIAIIGVLVALLLPAVQAAREAANRMSCGNNLKQLGIAVHNYHDTIKRLPPGNIGTNSASANGANNGVYYDGMMGWPALILPYMEQQPLYDSINFNVKAYTSQAGDSYFGVYGVNGDPLNKLASERMPPSLVCPSAPRGGDEAEFKDYGINGGNACCPERQTLPNGGLAHKNSKLKIASIVDGTSNTILFADSQSYDEEAALQPYGSAGNPFFWVNHMSNGYVLGGYIPNARQDKLTGRISRSSHPGGVQVCLADGSVRFVSETIAAALWQGAFTVNGGEATQLP